MHRLPPVTASPHLPAWAKILLLVTFQVNWKGAERGFQESKGASSQGHALWKEVGRKPYGRFNTGRAGVGSLFMSGFSNFWNVVYILRKGCNKSSLTLSKWSCTHPCSCILGRIVVWLLLRFCWGSWECQMFSLNGRRAARTVCFS